jgi:hypothetical protein
MFARIKFVSPGSPEKYSWVIDTERESVDHWRHAHPEAENLDVTPLDESEGLLALFWQKCLYHDVFFERSACREVRAHGEEELREIMQLAGRLPKGKASELWNRCMDFRFGVDQVVKSAYSHRLPT